jgi:(p)ppGpp synthase/HD superfamily hydrolase
METKLILTAIDIASTAHRGTTRKYNNEPYIVHPKRVANLVEFKVQDEHLIAAAWLHDVLEDTEFDRAEMFQKVGARVFLLVTELTNPSKIWFPNPHTLKRADRKYLDRLHLRHVSPDAKFIKLCDRLDNIIDIQGADDEFKKLYKQETEILLAEVLMGIDYEYEIRLREALKLL